ncbi:MAG: hypothetical protein JWQ09_4088, partial [Segetibacter sp.]|nr:hypothetical protein [Segetibacter sp.]
LQVKATTFPFSKQPLDPPGFRLIQDYKTTGPVTNGIVALFRLNEAGDDKYMQVLFSGENNREFYSGKGPQSGTADIPYRTMPTPTLISRQKGEAWKRPFIAVYEPYTGTNNSTVERIENIDRSKAENFSAVKVFNKDGSRQIILQSLNPGQLQQKDDWKFKGSFGVINFDKNGGKYLYLGEGSQVSYQQYSVMINGAKGSANVLINGNTLTVTCNRETTISIKGLSAKTLTLTVAGKMKKLPVLKTKEGISFKIPVTTNAEIKFL